jgi:5-methylcytosine-specific restriction endonuclease McrA
MTWAHWSKSTPWKWKAREASARGGKWNRLRRRFLMLNPSCARCGLAGEEVHHIVPRERAPELLYATSNLMTLCRRCHRAEHQRSEV